MKNYERLALRTYLSEYCPSEDFYEVLDWIAEDVKDTHVLYSMYRHINKICLCDMIELLSRRVKHLLLLEETIEIKHNHKHND